MLFRSYGVAPLPVIEGRKGRGFPEGRAVVVINPEVERVVCDHTRTNPSQNTPVVPNMRRIVTRPSAASCSRRNSAKLSLATILRRPPSFR